MDETGVVRTPTRQAAPHRPRIHGAYITPEWGLGASIGVGGFVGSYVGARLQSRLPEASLRRFLGLIACLVAVRYTQIAIQQSSSRTPAPVVSR